MSRHINWILLIGLSLVWGSSFFLIKKALVVFDPIQVASIRVSIAGLLFCPLLFKEIGRVDKKDFKWLVVVGLIGSALPAFFYAWAQVQLPSATAGMLNSLTPLFTLVLGVLFFSFPLLPRKLIGVLVGLIGAVFLILAGSGEVGVTTSMKYASFIVLATLCYAVSGNVVNRFLPHCRSLSISVIAYGLVFPIALVLLFNTDFLQRLNTQSFAGWSLAAAVTLGVVGTAIASIFYFALVRRTSALFASMVTYLIPGVAVVLGMIDGEVLTLGHFFGLILIIAGVYLSRQ